MQLIKRALPAVASWLIAGGLVYVCISVVVLWLRSRFGLAEAFGVGGVKYWQDWLFRSWSLFPAMATLLAVWLGIASGRPDPPRLRSETMAVLAIAVGLLIASLVFTSSRPWESEPAAAAAFAGFMADSAGLGAARLIPDLTRRAKKPA